MGANGVILITTKGKSGKLKFEINLYQVQEKYRENIPMLNSNEYHAP
jgi:hypothetical protein